MVEHKSWSTSAGNWLGIPVRVHLFVYLMLIAIFAAEWNFGTNNANFFAGTAMATALVFLASIILHELAHVFTVSNLGGHTVGLVMMPWGGSSVFSIANNGYQRALVFFAGPFANGIVFCLGTALLVQSDSSTFLQSINPFEPHWFDPLDWQTSLVKIAVWVNFQLMVVNLLPCYPFDGAQIIRALISTMNVELPRYRIETAIKVMGHAVAFTFIGLAWLFRDVNSGPVRPVWMLLLGFGVVLWFAARYSLTVETSSEEEPWEDQVPAPEFDSLSAEAAFLGFAADGDNIAYSQWLNEKVESRREEDLRREAEEDSLADEILQKLHDGNGLDSLSEDERLLLDRVSERIRRRRQQGV